MHIPPGYAVVFPYLAVTDSERLLRFLTDAFDARIASRHEAPDGRLMNAEVEIGGSRFMVGGSCKPEDARPGHYYIYVANADETHRRALAAGGKEVAPVGDKPYRDRQGGVADPVGNTWWISQRLEAGPYR